MSSAEFYDNYISSQIKSGINDRIYGLYKRLCLYNLESHTSVLEVGCGIGTLTYLLLKKVHPENIEAIDISPKSIEFARKHLNSPGVCLTATDIINYQPRTDSFDRILFFDVLEHIPLEQHADIFRRVGRWMHDDSLLLINIPNPAYILFDRENNPAALQETDQPVYIAQLAQDLSKGDLDILLVETYSVWVGNDYQFIVAKKRQRFEEKFVSEKRSFLAKGKTWFGRKWRKIRFPYPPAKS
jgi:trans-aconitate 2-methyltransferase